MALTPVRGVSLLAHAVRGLAESGCVRHIVVTVTPDDVEGTRSALGDPALPARVLVINSRTDIDCDDIGGDDIAAVRAGLLAALDDVPDAATVLVHDPLRAFAPPELIRSVVAAVGLGAGAVVPVLPLTDTVKRVDQYGRVVGTPDRAALRVVQTPLGFPVDVLRADIARDRGHRHAVRRAGVR